jgi:adenylate cyclase class 2
MSRDSQEIEIKLPVSDANAARRILRAGGFRVIRRRTFEANTVFDTPEQDLRQSGRLLRLREAGSAVTFTYKGPAEISKHKSREELEVTVSVAQPVAAILQRLGFVPVFRYEKYRTEWGRPAQRGVATIDETPVGVYIELEGTPPWIDRTARQLGFAEKDYITASYGRLYLDWCAQKGVQPCNMVF